MELFGMGRWDDGVDSEESSKVDDEVVLCSWFYVEIGGWPIFQKSESVLRLLKYFAAILLVFLRLPLTFGKIVQLLLLRELISYLYNLAA